MQVNYEELENVGVLDSLQLSILLRGIADYFKPVKSILTDCAELLTMDYTLALKQEGADKGLISLRMGGEFSTPNYSEFVWVSTGGKTLAITSATNPGVQYNVYLTKTPTSYFCQTVARVLSKLIPEMVSKSSFYANPFCDQH